MKGNYAADTFTENDVLLCLERAGLKFRNGSRYILSQCPLHDDENPSTQIFKDDWFVDCHAGCGRFHITKPFPELRKGNDPSYAAAPRQAKPMTEHKYKQFDLMEEWQKMPMIPRDHEFKTIPLEVLDELGWRFDKLGNRYFIPYFSASKQSIPFAQYRNLGDGPRFNFLKDAKPTCYGTWNLDNSKLFVVEGTSDCAVLDYAAVPWIGLPSAASGELMKAMATYAKTNGIELIYAGDNDAAGDKLRAALDEVMPYRVKQARSPYKDWGEMLEAEGIDSVRDYCFEELFGKQEYPTTPAEASLASVQDVWPGAEELKIVDAPKSKEQSGAPTPLY